MLYEYVYELSRYLISAPVPYGSNAETKDHSRPGEVRADDWPEQFQCVRRRVVIRTRDVVLVVRPDWSRGFEVISYELVIATDCAESWRWWARGIRREEEELIDWLLRCRVWCLWPWPYRQRSEDKGVSTALVIMKHWRRVVKKWRRQIYWRWKYEDEVLEQVTSDRDLKDDWPQVDISGQKQLPN